MDINDMTYIPHNDIDVDDLTMVSEHTNLINNNQYHDATTLLNDNNFNKGFRASLFNLMAEKIKTLQTYLLAKEVESGEYISSVEPSDEDMEGKDFWLQPY